jgi:hypothetical protein
MTTGESRARAAQRVHFELIDCLISFGRRWHSDAQEALIARGLEVPTGEDSG